MAEIFDLDCHVVWYIDIIVILRDHNKNSGLSWLTYVINLQVTVLEECIVTVDLYSELPDI
jgi:hypothetical protein